ncbi:MAG: hypothetical protein ACRDH6_07655 [Actinomycetota bacterium]
MAKQAGPAPRMGEDLAIALTVDERDLVPDEARHTTASRDL